MRPILKWAGGKARLAPQIDTTFNEPCRGTYYEPFMGAGSVFFYRRAMGRVGKAVLSDVNDRLMALHRVVRDEPHALIEAMTKLPSEDWRERYYEVREEYNAGPQVGAAHAARFVWLNRAGFNGLYRENRDGKFNVPRGSYATLKLPEGEHIVAISELLAGVELVSASFEEVMSYADEDDQVYCDPPYMPLTETACFTGYASVPFGLREQMLLATCARKAAMKGARVVLSNHDLPVVRSDIYPKHGGFEHVASPRVARAISRNAAKREAAPEVIAAIGPLARVRSA